MQRTGAGSIVGIVTSIALGAAMLPLRSHLSVATAALVLVVPVVVGVVIGGFTAGVASLAAGFLVYDVGFIAPYDRLSVGRPEDWVALAVYVVVMLLVARVVATLDASRAEAQRRTAEAQRLAQLSELLVEDRIGGGAAQDHRRRRGHRVRRPRRRPVGAGQRPPRDGGLGR